MFRFLKRVAETGDWEGKKKPDTFLGFPIDVKGTCAYNFFHLLQMLVTTLPEKKLHRCFGTLLVKQLKHPKQSR